MNPPAPPALTADDLQRLLRQADPAALLVPPRILRRVIKQHRGLGGLGLQVPHRKSYVIGRDALLRIADRDELGLPPDAPLPETLLLFPSPDAERLETQGREKILEKYWRLLFHARVHLALGRRLADGKLTAEALRERIRRIGLTAFDEARAVLRQEHFLLPPIPPAGEDFAVYEEFAALYLELRHFAPELLPSYFPAIQRFEEVDAVLAQDVDAAELAAATRLEDAFSPLSQGGKGPGVGGPLLPSPLGGAGPGVRGTEATPTPPPPLPPSGGDPAAYRRLLERAARRAALGNGVRAAILRTRAARAAEGSEAEAARNAARADLDSLTQRLRNALGLSERQTAAWRQALEPLLAPAADGRWPVEARLLYDLQKVCLDQERDIYAVDIVEWFVSWGRRPVMRLLPHQRDVLAVKHLRGALHKLTAVRLGRADRTRLAGLVQAAVHDREHRLRERLRPEIRNALDEVGLSPYFVAERVSRDKLIEELLDRVIERNFLTIGDLRDAIARNRVKLPDLVNPVTFFLGDRIICANRRLAVRLDGIYRRGEIYLRWLQRLSSAAFGNPVGRFLTRFVALPFGGSYMILKMWEEIEGLLRGKPPPEEPPPLAELPEEGAEGGEELARETAKVQQAAGVDPYVWGALGIFFLLLLHVPPFRRGVLAGLKLAWRGARGLCYDLPLAFLALPWVRRVLQSRPYLLFYQYLFKPLLPAGLAGLGVYLAGRRPVPALATAAGAFLVASVVLHSRLGMYLEEVGADALVRTWHLIRSDLLPGLVRWVLFVFRRLVEDVERLLYTVDEWLRFRKGDSRLSLFTKPVLGLIWFFLTYLIRLIVNVFVEPTFNPIKHFPVVTVTAKALLPFYPTLIRLFASPLEPLFGKWAGDLLALGAVGLLPGLGGFLVWELKENWRLYRANQSPTLAPEVVGHHGETVLRLMRPGLHSGTLPKLYARLRRARGRSARRQHEALAAVAECLHRFVQRDLLAILATSRTFAGTPFPKVGAIHLATNRIRIELRAGDADNLFVELEEHAGWLLAGTVAGPTWLSRLSAEQALAFRDALAGFYKLAGVGLVREQVEPFLPPGTAYDVTEAGLVVWPAPDLPGGAVYDLLSGPQLHPRPLLPDLPDGLKPVAERDFLFRCTPVLWEDWVKIWESDHAGAGHVPLVPATVRLLRTP